MYIQPGAKTVGFAGMHDDRVKIRLKAQAVDGKANEALIQFLAVAFRVKKSSLMIVSGHASRLKTVQIENPGAIPDEVCLSPS
ncbi:MAG: DUF167 domain-containing protein [Francisellaceae bacterium]